ncbi:hypothetical protein DFQ27_001256 [Actinomortierella ambigua]|uniref:Myb-like domain-containing protein n=1 Tax=Actinomortierella ambigua TaxID=1343610 RepID=A0A9P6U7V4_9FUNG|nr:hypothetical protein DFQ27_001256 [Actinomortierella ambigua]
MSWTCKFQNASSPWRNVCWMKDARSMATTVPPPPRPQPQTATLEAQRDPTKKKKKMKPSIQWTKELDDQLRELGAQAGKTLAWHEVSNKLQISRSSLYARYCKLMDPRLEQLVQDEDRMRQLDHLVSFQLHWLDIAKIMHVPSFVLEAAFKRRHPAMASPHMSRLMKAADDPRYQLHPSSPSSTTTTTTTTRSMTNKNNKSRSRKNKKDSHNNNNTTIMYLGYPLEPWPEMDWQAISTELFKDKIEPEVLRANYQRCRVSQLRFSTKDHEHLRAAVLTQLKATPTPSQEEGLMEEEEDESRLDWDRIHHEGMGGRYSPGVCRHAWARQKEPNFPLNPWQEPEMITYWQQYLMQGQQWHLIARHLPNRTALDCRRDFQKLAKKADLLGDKFKQRVIDGLRARKGASGGGVPVKFPTFFFSATSWTPELDARLMTYYHEARAQFSPRVWDSVAARLNVGASALQCTHRVEKLQSEAAQRVNEAALEEGHDKLVQVTKDDAKKEQASPAVVMGDDHRPVQSNSWSKKASYRSSLTTEEKERLTHLVQTINPTQNNGWDKVSAQMPGRPIASLKVLWNEFQRAMIIDDPQGREAVERSVLRHGDGMWHAIGDDLTAWLYRHRGGSDSGLSAKESIPIDPKGAARVRPKMAKMLWTRLSQDRRHSPIWTPHQLEVLQKVVREVVVEGGEHDGGAAGAAGAENGRSLRPTIDDWLVIGRRVEGKSSLHCMTMWHQLQKDPKRAQQRLVAQAVLQHLWIHGRLPTTERDKAQWRKDNPGLPLQVPDVLLAQKLPPQRPEVVLAENPTDSPRKNDIWLSQWDDILEMAVERYGATHTNYLRLAEILGTTPHQVSCARHRMVRRNYLKSAGRRK